MITDIHTNTIKEVDNSLSKLKNTKKNIENANKTLEEISSYALSFMEYVRKTDNVLAYAAHKFAEEMTNKIKPDPL